MCNSRCIPRTPLLGRTGSLNASNRNRLHESPRRTHALRCGAIGERGSSASPREQQACLARRSVAAAIIAGSFSPLLANAQGTVDLPAGFTTLSREMIKALRAPIELEEMGASELEIRRKADNARDPIRRFINDWKDNPRVSGSPVYKELSSSLEELGQFYMRKGQRAPLDKATATSILNHLDRAELQLPALPEKKGFLPNLFGS